MLKKSKTISINSNISETCNLTPFNNQISSSIYFEELLVEIINNCIGEKHFQGSLDSIAELNTLIFVLKKINPNIEECTESNFEEFNKNKEDDFDSYYDGFLNVFLILLKYFDLKKTTIEFLDNKPDINNIKISELISSKQTFQTQKQVFQLAKIVILLGFLSVKKNYYLDKVKTLGDEHIKYFLSIIGENLNLESYNPDDYGEESEESEEAEESEDNEDNEEEDESLNQENKIYSEGQDTHNNKSNLTQSLKSDSRDKSEELNESVNSNFESAIDSNNNSNYYNPLGIKNKRSTSPSDLKIKEMINHPYIDMFNTNDLNKENFKVRFSNQSNSIYRKKKSSNYNSPNKQYSEDLQSRKENETNKFVSGKEIILEDNEEQTENLEEEEHEQHNQTYLTSEPSKNTSFPLNITKSTNTKISNYSADKYIDTHDNNNNNGNIVINDENLNNAEKNKTISNHEDSFANLRVNCSNKNTIESNNNDNSLHHYCLDKYNTNKNIIPEINEEKDDILNSNLSQSSVSSSHQELRQEDEEKDFNDSNSNRDEYFPTPMLKKNSTGLLVDDLINSDKIKVKHYNTIPVNNSNVITNDNVHNCKNNKKTISFKGEINNSQTSNKRMHETRTLTEEDYDEIKDTVPDDIKPRFLKHSNTIVNAKKAISSNEFLKYKRNSLFVTGDFEELQNNLLRKRKRNSSTVSNGSINHLLNINNGGSNYLTGTFTDSMKESVTSNSEDVYKDVISAESIRSKSLKIKEDTTEKSENDTESTNNMNFTPIPTTQIKASKRNSVNSNLILNFKSLGKLQEKYDPPNTTGDQKKYTPFAFFDTDNLRLNNRNSSRKSSENSGSNNNNLFSKVSIITNNLVRSKNTDIQRTVKELNRDRINSLYTKDNNIVVNNRRGSVAANFFTGIKEINKRKKTKNGSRNSNKVTKKNSDKAISKFSIYPVSSNYNPPRFSKKHSSLNYKHKSRRADIYNPISDEKMLILEKAGVLEFTNKVREDLIKFQTLYEEKNSLNEELVSLNNNLMEEIKNLRLKNRDLLNENGDLDNIKKEKLAFEELTTKMEIEIDNLNHELLDKKITIEEKDKVIQNKDKEIMVCELDKQNISAKNEALTLHLENVKRENSSLKEQVLNFKNLKNSLEEMSIIKKLYKNLQYDMEILRRDKSNIQLKFESVSNELRVSNEKNKEANMLLRDQEYLLKELNFQMNVMRSELEGYKNNDNNNTNAVYLENTTEEEEESDDSKSSLGKKYYDNDENNDENNDDEDCLNAKKNYNSDNNSINKINVKSKIKDDDEVIFGKDGAEYVEKLLSKNYQSKSGVLLKAYNKGKTMRNRDVDTNQHKLNLNNTNSSSSIDNLNNINKHYNSNNNNTYKCYTDRVKVNQDNTDEKEKVIEEEKRKKIKSRQSYVNVNSYKRNTYFNKIFERKSVLKFENLLHISTNKLTNIALGKSTSSITNYNNLSNNINSNSNANKNNNNNTNSSAKDSKSNDKRMTSVRFSDTIFSKQDDADENNSITKKNKLIVKTGSRKSSILTTKSLVQINEEELDKKQKITNALKKSGLISTDKFNEEKYQLDLKEIEDYHKNKNNSNENNININEDDNDSYVSYSERDESIHSNKRRNTSYTKSNNNTNTLFEVFDEKKENLNDENNSKKDLQYENSDEDTNKSKIKNHKLSELSSNDRNSSYYALSKHSSQTNKSIKDRKDNNLNTSRNIHLDNIIFKPSYENTNEELETNFINYQDYNNDSNNHNVKQNKDNKDYNDNKDLEIITNNTSKDFTDTFKFDNIPTNPGSVSFNNYPNTNIRDFSNKIKPILIHDSNSDLPNNNSEFSRIKKNRSPKFKQNSKKSIEKHHSNQISKISKNNFSSNFSIHKKGSKKLEELFSHNENEDTCNQEDNSFDLGPRTRQVSQIPTLPTRFKQEISTFANDNSDLKAQPHNSFKLLPTETFKNILNTEIAKKRKNMSLQDVLNEEDFGDMMNYPNNDNDKIGNNDNNISENEKAYNTKIVPISKEQLDANKATIKDQENCILSLKTTNQELMRDIKNLSDEIKRITGVDFANYSKSFEITEEEEKNTEAYKTNDKDNKEKEDYENINEVNSNVVLITSNKDEKSKALLMIRDRINNKLEELSKSNNINSENVDKIIEIMKLQEQSYKGYKDSNANIEDSNSDAKGKDKDNQLSQEEINMYTADIYNRILNTKVDLNELLEMKQQNSDLILHKGMLENEIDRLNSIIKSYNEKKDKNFEYLMRVNQELKEEISILKEELTSNTRLSLTLLKEKAEISVVSSKGVLKKNNNSSNQSYSHSDNKVISNNNNFSSNLSSNISNSISNNNICTENSYINNSMLIRIVESNSSNNYNVDADINSKNTKNNMNNINNVNNKEYTSSNDYNDNTNKCTVSLKHKTINSSFNNKLKLSTLDNTYDLTNNNIENKDIKTITTCSYSFIDDPCGSGRSNRTSLLDKNNLFNINKNTISSNNPLASIEILNNNNNTEDNNNNDYNDNEDEDDMGKDNKYNETDKDEMQNNILTTGNSTVDYNNYISTTENNILTTETECNEEEKQLSNKNNNYNNEIENNINHNSLTMTRLKELESQLSVKSCEIDELRNQIIKANEDITQLHEKNQLALLKKQNKIEELSFIIVKNSISYSKSKENLMKLTCSLGKNFQTLKKDFEIALK